MMYWGGEGNQKGSKVEDDLAPYRRLVELQKEMIALSQKHEHSKREGAGAEEQVAREVEILVRRRASFSQRLRRSTSKFITRLPGFAVVLVCALKTINSKTS